MNAPQNLVPGEPVRTATDVMVAGIIAAYSNFRTALNEAVPDGDPEQLASNALQQFAVTLTPDNVAKLLGATSVIADLLRYANLPGRTTEPIAEPLVQLGTLVRETLALAGRISPGTPDAGENPESPR
jgi:hypothetical protein